METQDRRSKLTIITKMKARWLWQILAEIRTQGSDKQWSVRMESEMLKVCPGVSGPQDSTDNKSHSYKPYKNEPLLNFFFVLRKLWNPENILMIKSKNHWTPITKSKLILSLVYFIVFLCTYTCKNQFLILKNLKMYSIFSITIFPSIFVNRYFPCRS